MRFDFDRYEFADTTTDSDAPAVQDAQQTLSWRQLHEATDAWISRAREAGLAPGMAVVISGHKEAAFFVAMLACLRMGVTYVPVDTINPPERIKKLIGIVLAPAHYNAGTDRFEAGSPDPQPLKQAGLAYIMFTSGSTGEPKGVQIGRESVALFAGWIRDCLKLGPAPAFMNQMLFSFDFSLFDFCGALVTGGVCVLCPRDVIAERDGFVEYLAGHKIEVWASTPSFVRQQLFNADFDHAHLPDLKVFVFGAESLTPTLAEELWSRFPKVRIINSYGPTEATCSTTWVEIDPALRAKAPLPFPIGRAKPYAEVFLQDGEICIAGDHVMYGYLNRPDLDQNVLFTHNGKRAYHSGDLGEIDADGLVTFRGRKDDQIKMHGYRIELAEVDAALATLPGVRAGATVALRRPDGTLVRMIGFVELAHASENPGLGPLPAELANWKELLGLRMPPYMIPSELLACGLFPTTNSDKVDRKKLERMYLDARLTRTAEKS